MGKLNILKSAQNSLNNVKISGQGWWKEPDRHSKAAKFGHAGGQYSTSDSSGVSSNKNKTQKHAHSVSTDWSGNKFCEICGKAL